MAQQLTGVDSKNTGDKLTAAEFNLVNTAINNNAQSLGFIDYNDNTGTVSVPANTWTDVPNNGAGPFTNKQYAPINVNELLDPATGYLDFSDLDLGDSVQIRIDFKVRPNINNAKLQCRYVLGSGANEYALSVFEKRLDSGSGIDYDSDKGSFFIYMGDENTRGNPGKLQVRVSSAATLDNSGIAIQVTR